MVTAFKLKDTWANAETYPLRQAKCLCLNCSVASCQKAQGLFRLCNEQEIEVLTISCKDFIRKKARQEHRDVL